MEVLRVVLISLIAAAILSVGVATPSAASPLTATVVVYTAYTTTDLGTLSQLEEYGYGWSWARAINDSGQVVGDSSTDDWSYHAFLWTKDDQMIDLGTLEGGTYSTAWDINNAGQIVGDGGFGAVLWTKAADGGYAMTGLGSGQAFGINDAEQIVGTDGGQAVLWAKDVDGNYRQSGLGAGTAYAINNDGKIVGTDGGQAVLWTKGVDGNYQQTSLISEYPDGYSVSGAYDINESGEVVGYLWGNPLGRAFLWTETGGMKVIAPLADEKSNFALAINNSGQVVGHSYSDVAGQAFVWRPVMDEDRLTALYPIAGYSSEARDINSSGMVVGRGYSSNYYVHASSPITFAPASPPRRAGVIQA